MTRANLADPESRVGSTLGGKYRLERVLGVGGMGAVYEAVNTWTQRRVAVKLTLQGGPGRDANMAPRFLREARAASRIEHPNIVQILDMGQDGDEALYIVQEFLVGSDLGHLLESREKLPVREALEILVPVMTALAALHAQGIVHRDIKPDNIFLVQARGALVPKLIDFGIAKINDGESLGLTRTGSAMGTPFYMSPEQARGERDIDAQSDVWAMGVVMYEALAGRGPFTGDNYNALLARILLDPVPPVTGFAVDVPQGLADVIHRALERDRAQRFASMEGFLAALLACPDLAPEPWFQALRAAHEGAVQGAIAPLLPARSSAPLAATPDGARRTPEADALGHAATLASGVPASVTPAHPRASRPTLTRGPRRWMYGVLLVACVGATTAVVLSARQRGGASAATTASATRAEATPRSYHVRVRALPAGASLQLDGVPAGEGALERDFARDGTVHRLRVSAAGYEAQTVTFRDAPPAEQLELTALPPPPSAPAVTPGAATTNAVGTTPSAPAEPASTAHNAASATSATSAHRPAAATGASERPRHHASAPTSGPAGNTPATTAAPRGATTTPSSSGTPRAPNGAPVIDLDQ